MTASRLGLLAWPLLLLVAQPAASELVRVRLASQQSGHAWLFGSPVDAACWVATPAHVLRGPDGALQRAVLVLPDGREAHFAGEPVQPDPERDLAFARVRLGRRCLDRLGPENAGSLIETADRVRLRVRVGSVERGYTVRIASMDDVRLVVEPTRGEDRLVQGFSGGLVDVPEAGLGDTAVPVALLLSVCDPGEGAVSFDDEATTPGCDGEHHYGVALRFDAVRETFLGHVADGSGAEDGAASGSPRRVEILTTRGRTLDAASGPGRALHDPDPASCWRVRGDAYGRASVRIRTEAPIERVRVRACASASSEAPVGMGLRYRLEGSEVWATLRYCRAGGEAGVVVDCTVAPVAAAEYELQFKAAGKERPLAVGRISVE